MSAPEILTLKKLGNVALVSGIYSQALKYYTEALTLFNNDLNLITKSVENGTFGSDLQLQASIYSKRSVAFLRLGHYYFAFEDAKQIVAKSPEWFKGYLRKADVELNCGLYQDALKDYQMALRYISGDDAKGSHYEKLIDQKIQHVLFLMQQERSFDLQLPWIGAAFGLVVGMAIITWDYVSNYNKAYVKHPMLKLALLGFIAYLFFLLTSQYRSWSRKHKLELLQPPQYNIKNNNNLGS